MTEEDQIQMERNTLYLRRVKHVKKRRGQTKKQRKGLARKRLTLPSQTVCALRTIATKLINTHAPENKSELQAERSGLFTGSQIPKKNARGTKRNNFLQWQT